MRAELAGQGHNYGLPYALASIGDAARHTYDRTRGAL